ncbi:MAG: tRNA (adenosine(37)-N6)-threonylcarbamoyltransferase complex ATPase subunit type 1 TsaE [Desulfovibrio sp.]|jgi:tRNA threonylcarbamoyladenosine biosynthesis protein TsaE|nr:tRNA (adenosine(37)-N6)-threonylcarbamoyltransferase complex ATPase subunit type 1 TsaE [Desulfovibrio sp.]
MYKSEIALDSLADTEKLARSLAGALLRGNPGAILLYGEPGAGKSALAGALVRSLPGGGEAEPSSPSFTLCNIYCTIPPIHHFDLYRLPYGPGDDALLESFADESVLTLVEWPENLDPDDFPADGISLRLRRPEDYSPEGSSRLVALESLGPCGEIFLRRLDLDRLFVSLNFR